MEELLKQFMEQMNKKFDDFAVGQSEMRKEMAFYYGSLMREIENSRMEALSQFKHLENVVDQHRGAIELLGELAKVGNHKDS